MKSEATDPALALKLRSTVFNRAALILFLVTNGLKLTHKFIDIGGGSLRLGQYIIPFLESGNYYGLESENLLVECGIEPA